LYVVNFYSAFALGLSASSSFLFCKNLSDPGYFPMDYNDDINEQTGHYREDNRMRVFGDSRIKLYQPLLTVNAYDSGRNPVSADF
jgi:hypothetical protein